jgi:heparan-alpha-glucosaminide N-acetyltransferase
LRSGGTPGSETVNPGRLASLDAYRGLVMLLLVTQGFPIPLLASQLGLPFSEQLERQFLHVDWEGCALWDLVQPSFMLMVGVALPYSIASRAAKGQSRRRIAAHALYRCVVLILLGWLILSNGQPRTQFLFAEDVLIQIALAYPFALLLVGRSPWVQGAAISAILVAYWLAFAFHPLPPPGFDYAMVGVPADWTVFTGFFAHWNRGANLAGDFDLWFLNLFPRDQPFQFSKHGLQTLNFIPSIATLGIGVMTGELFRSPLAPRAKLGRILVAGVALLAVGWLAGATICPLVKSIWTPSWVPFSAGWVLLLLGASFWLVDILGWHRPAFPLIVVGMNSIAMYCLQRLLMPWIDATIATHLGGFSWTLNRLLTFVVLWSICFWMYRRRLFLRV